MALDWCVLRCNLRQLVAVTIENELMHPMVVIINPCSQTKCAPPYIYIYIHICIYIYLLGHDQWVKAKEGRSKTQNSKIIFANKFQQIHSCIPSPLHPTGCGRRAGLHKTNICYCTPCTRYHVAGRKQCCAEASFCEILHSGLLSRTVLLS